MSDEQSRPIFKNNTRSFRERPFIEGFSVDLFSDVTWLLSVSKFGVCWLMEMDLQSSIQPLFFYHRMGHISMPLSENDLPHNMVGSHK